MGYRFLGAHVNTTVGGVPETVQVWKPPLVVLLDHSDVWHDVKKASPNTAIVGRIYQQFEPDFNDPNLDPLLAARDHCDKILPWAERMGETYDYWQGVNEPIIKSPEAMQRCAEFDAERARIMDENGFRVVVGSFSVGNPELALWADFLPALEAALQFDGTLALHEYAWPTLDRQWEWYLLRHRKVYNGEPDHDWEGLPDHLKELPLLITECGLDGLIELGHPPRGWRFLYEDQPDEYLQQLAWYDAELEKDPYVAGAAIYCCGVTDRQWAGYDIWHEVAQVLAREATPVYRLGEVEPSEPTDASQPTQPTEPLEPEVLPVAGWEMDLKFRPGPRIIAGSLPEANIEITITDPWGNASTVMSGSKPEYGEGGFEVLASHEANYSVAFLGEIFEVKTRDQSAILAFTKVDLPPETEELPEVVDEPVEPPDEVTEQPAEPLEPPDEPQERPVEPSEPSELPDDPSVPPDEPVQPPDDVPPPPDDGVEHLDENEMLDMILERVDRIAELLRERLSS